MENHGAEDRRLFQRFPVDLAAAYTSTDAPGRCQVETFDISAQGICLLLPQALASGTELELSLKLPQGEEAFPAHGTVVWSRKIGSGFRAGILFHHAELMEVSTVLRSARSWRAN